MIFPTVWSTDLLQLWDTGIDDDVSLLGKDGEERVQVLWENIGERQFVEWGKAKGR